MCYYMVGVYRGCGRTIGQEECDVLLYGRCIYRECGSTIGQEECDVLLYGRCI